MQPAAFRAHLRATHNQFRHRGDVAQLQQVARHDEIPVVFVDFLLQVGDALLARAPAACSCARCPRNPTSAAGFRPSCARPRPFRPDCARCRIATAEFSNRSGRRRIFCDLLPPRGARKPALPKANCSPAGSRRAIPCRPPRRRHTSPAMSVPPSTFVTTPPHW